MTTAPAPTPCLRCGSFPGEGGFPVADIALCDACLSTREIDDRAEANPPTLIVWLRFAFVGAVGAVALLMMFSAALPIGILAPIFAPIAAALLVQNVGNHYWRRRVVDRLGLANVPDAARWTFARYVPTAANRRVPSAEDVGLLAEGEHGLAFLGVRGRRFALPFRNIARADLDRAGMTTFLRLHLRDMSSRAFLFLQGGVFVHRPHLAAALRIRSRLAP